MRHDRELGLGLATKAHQHIDADQFIVSFFNKFYHLDNIKNPALKI